MDLLRAEAELVERAKTNPEAFGELYEKYIERIYNYVYFRVGSVHDAETSPPSIPESPEQPEPLQICGIALFRLVVPHRAQFDRQPSSRSIPQAGNPD